MLLFRGAFSHAVISAPSGGTVCHTASLIFCGRSGVFMKSIPLLPPDAPLWFPPAEEASPEGVVAAGADLSPERLVFAYASGLFPWYSEETPILWWSPDPRCVLFTKEAHIPRRLSRTIRHGRFSFTFDTIFDRIIEHCATVPRSGRPGTWLLPEMITAYKEMHKLGLAHSVETWEELEGKKQLVGGLYGLQLGHAFFGESMFHLRPDASKAAVAALVAVCQELDIAIIDCQQTTAHMLRFGAREIPRDHFLKLLRYLV